VLARLELLLQPAGVRPSVYELRPFFAIIAFSISRSKLRSATSRFNRPFSFQGPKLLRFAGLHATELRLPSVDRVLGHPALTGYVLRRPPSFHLLQCRNNRALLCLLLLISASLKSEIILADVPIQGGRSRGATTAAKRSNVRERRGPTSVVSHK
jgi:hypothetical protein